MSYEETTLQPKKGKHNLIYGVLIIALLSTWGYIIYDKSKSTVKIEQLQTQYVNVDNNRNQVQQLYNASLIRLDSLLGINQQLNDSLRNQAGMTSERTREIEKLRTEIRSILADKNASANKLEIAKQKIDELNSNITNYITEIEALKDQNQELVVKNEQAVTAKELAEKNLEESQKELKSTVDLGSTLHVSGINVIPIHEKSSGEEKETTTAKRVSKLRILFNIDENRIASSGEKELYVCLYGPDDKPITIQAYGSGSFDTREEGKKFFTSKVSVTYTKGKRSAVSFDWRQDQTFEAGDYRVEVYHNGFKIGEGVTKLKKGGLFS